MKKSLLGLVVLSGAITLSACSSTTNSSASSFGSADGSYNRNKVCSNLTQQIEFNNDKGYAATNVGAAQVQQQQLLAAYKANGCDK